MATEKNRPCPYCGGDKSNWSYKLPNKLTVCKQCYLDKNPLAHYNKAALMRRLGVSREDIEEHFGIGAYHVRPDLIYKLSPMQMVYSLLMRGKKVTTTKKEENDAV